MPIRTSIFSTLIAFSASAAFAEGAGFATLDSDGSGGLSLEEVQAVAPDVTAEIFAYYDSDRSGELSDEEFAHWKSGADKNAE